MPTKYFYDESKQKLGKGFEIVDGDMLYDELIDKAISDTEETFRDAHSKNYVLECLYGFKRNAYEGFVSFF